MRFELSERGKRILAVACAALLGVSLLAAFAYVVWPRPTKLAFRSSVLWGLLLLASFAGWGALINTTLFKQRRADLGLRAAWGFAFAIAVCGPLCLFGLAVKGALIACVGAGLIALAVIAFRERTALVEAITDVALFTAKSPLLAVIVVATLFAGTILFLGSLGDRNLNDCDDYIAYLQFPKEILQSGSLIQPFSLRRLSTLGGQSLLHALMLAESSELRLHVVDRGLCLLLTLLLILGHARTHRTSSLFVIVALGVLVTLPNTRINTSSQMSGVVCFLGLFRTLRFVEGGRPISNAVVIALMASAACTLRQNYMAAVAILLTTSYAFVIWNQRSLPWRDRLREPALAAVLLLAVLVPWMALSYRSSGTFLFPVVLGNFRPGFPMLEHASNTLVELSFQIANFAYNEPVRTLPLFVLSAVLVRDHERKALHALLVAAVLAAIYLVHSFSATDTGNLARYYYGFMVAVVLATLLSAGSASAELDAQKPWALAPAGLIALLAGLLQIHEVRANTPKQFDLELKAIEAELRLRDPLPAPTKDDSLYRELQQSIPENAPLLVMLDQPFRLDYKRNPVYNIDIPGAASPERGLPIFQGPEAVAKYLLAHDIRFLAFVMPERSAILYRRSVWENHRRGPVAFWREQADFYLDVMANFEKLAETRQHMADVSGMVMLDLATPRNAAPNAAL